MHGLIGAIASLEWRVILIIGLFVGCARVLVSFLSGKPSNGRADLISGCVMFCLSLGAALVWSGRNFVEICLVLSVGYVFEGLVTLVRERQNPITAFSKR